MPLIDIITFPILIISTPTAQFPDKLKIVMSGYNTSTTADANAYQSQVAANAKVAAGGTTAPTIVSTTWTESVFTETQGDNTIAKLTPPYNNISGVVGYAHRNDSNDNTEVPVTMYTTQPNATPSSTTTTYDISSVWGYQFTMTKQTMNSTYIAEYVNDTVPIGQTASIISQFSGFFGTIVSEIMKPTLPTAKQIASIFLGPAAAPLQMAISSVASQYAKIQPTVNQIVTAASAIQSIIQNPANIINDLPAIIAFLLQFIPQSTLAQIIYEFRGGAGA